MTSVLLQPGTRGCDGVSLSTLRDFSKVRAAGYEWVSLYLGGNYYVRPYAIEAAWAAGLPVMLNYERSEDDAKNGYPAGKRAAETALRQAQELGFHGEAPLPFSAADKHFADLAGAGLDYHRALVDVFTPHGWTGGAYGFREMLALIAQQEWWPDDWPLWHWGGDGSTIYPWTWVKQGPGGSYFDTTIGLQVDNNRLYKPMRFWSGYGTDKIEEPDMTSEEHDAVMKTEGMVNDILRYVSVPDPGHGTSMYWAALETHGAIVRTDDFVNEVVSKVVAALPPSSGGGGLTEAQVVQAVLTALRRGTG